MTDDVAIKVSHLKKSFRLPHERTTSIKNLFVNFYRKRRYETQYTLEDVSLEIKKGEFFGIVGRNGSGKSTLLKLLAKIYSPTSGSVEVNGILTPFIELGVGFNPELTGRENVYLNGALLGFSRKEMQAMYDDIVAFAELERFMDQKLKNYSSGMQVRLAFSIAIRAKSDILLVDEVLAVGDAAFQQKCFDVFTELKKRGTTMVLVTHDMGAVLRFCDRAALVNQGKVAQLGAPRDIADAYLELNYEAEAAASDGETTTTDKNVPRVTTVTMSGQRAGKQAHYKGGERAVFAIGFKNPQHQQLHFGFQIFNKDGSYCFGTNTSVDGQPATASATGKVSIEIDLQLMPGAYTVTAAVMNENATMVHDYRPKIAKFSIAQDTESEGIARLVHNWR